MLNFSKSVGLVFVVLFSFISCNKDDKIAKNIFNSWEIVNFVSLESGAYPKNNDYNPIIQFNKDGSYLLQLDVNNCNGNYTLSEENEITITTSTCTYVCCDSDFSEKITAMLPQVTSFNINKNKMKLDVPGWGWINLELHD